MSSPTRREASDDATLSGSTGEGNFWDENDFFESIGALQLPQSHPGLPAPQESGILPNWLDLSPGSGLQTTELELEAVKMSPVPDRPEAFSLVADITHSKVKVEKIGRNELVSDRKKLTKREKALLAARANREKRKREMIELRRSNAKLCNEKEEFRRIIADLQLQVQANREAGKIDLRTENELLRAELQEHKSFLAQFKRISDGSKVSTKEKHLAAIKGAKAASGQVLGVLHTSVVDPSWKRGYSRLHPELRIRYQRLPFGSTSKTASRITVRVDSPAFKASFQHMHDVQWLAWSDPELSSRLSSHFGQVREKEIKEVDLKLDSLKCDPDTKVKVYYHREERVSKAADKSKPLPKKKKKAKSESTDTVDTIFLVTSKKQDLPLNSIPANWTQTEPNRHMGTGTTSDPKVCPTIVMATTSTKHSRDIVSAKPGVNRIESALLEGLVVRKLDSDRLSLTWIGSYPVNKVSSYSSSDFLSTTAAEGWIDDEGFFTSSVEQACNDLMRIHAESLGAESARDYAMRAIEATGEAQEGNHAESG